ncbi:MAG TPA: hypothetical protein VGD10_07590 [Allosphingosinicella sp.]|uniref:DUF6894 family protein n=1 Tax=Allosphingosinicella sp. TaxID=2823234 RepID=UPI002ED903A2
MPAYFFHTRIGEDYLEDPEGLDLRDLAAAHRTAIRIARTQMAEEVMDGRLDLGSTVEVMDGGGETAFVLRFSEAIDIVRQREPEYEVRRAAESS